MRRAWRKQDGFTLIELLVSLSIFSIISLAVYSSFAGGVGAWRRAQEFSSIYQTARLLLDDMARELKNAVMISGTDFGSSLNALGTSADYTKALLLVEERLWDLEAKGSIVPGTFTGEFSEEDGGFRWEVKASELTEMRLCETQVTVSWKRRGRPRAVSIVTYLKREE